MLMQSILVFNIYSDFLWFYKTAQTYDACVIVNGTVNFDSFFSEKHGRKLESNFKRVFLKKFQLKSMSSIFLAGRIHSLSISEIINSRAYLYPEFRIWVSYFFKYIIMKTWGMWIANQYLEQTNILIGKKKQTFPINQKQLFPYVLYKENVPKSAIIIFFSIWEINGCFIENCYSSSIHVF